MIKKIFGSGKVTRSEAFIHLHFAVFLFGFTAILGRLISLGGIATVWYRMLFTTLSFIALPGMLKAFKSLSTLDLLKIATVGFLLSTHWMLFFGAIKISNVSVTLCCIATASFFTALLEPLIIKKPFRMHEALLGLLVVPGIYLIYTFTEVPIAGIVMGIASAILGTLFSVLNKKWVTEISPSLVTFAEMGIGLFLFSPIFIWQIWSEGLPSVIPKGWDMLWLLVLSLLCTSLAYISSLKALKVLSTFTVNLTINLEPVYGIIMAIAIFKEHKEMGVGFYLGALLVVGSVFLHPMLERKFEKNV